VAAPDSFARLIDPNPYELSLMPTPPRDLSGPGADRELGEANVVRLEKLPPGGERIVEGELA
jgi:hypothetical protein